MIFVTVGSQKFQFNRLLKEIDELIENKVINEEVFAQIGVSDYKPQNYKYKEFVTQDEFNKYLDEARLIITHAGTGVIVNAIKKGKKVIGIPRLSKFGEHVDDHQIQLLNEFANMNLIETCIDEKELKEKIQQIDNKEFKKYDSNNENFIKDIKEYIRKI
ncbi:glycosyltransferase family 28 protein [Clostridium sp. CAG:793]|nr:glycosyltransferase family 28 protein [Clostridium sp. CAG:793]